MGSVDGIAVVPAGIMAAFVIREIFGRLQRRVEGTESMMDGIALSLDQPVAIGIIATSICISGDHRWLLSGRTSSHRHHPDRDMEYLLPAAGASISSGAGRPRRSRPTWASGPPRRFETAAT